MGSTSFFNVHLRGWSRYRTYLTGSAMTADKASGLVKVESKNGF